VHGGRCDCCWHSTHGWAPLWNSLRTLMDIDIEQLEVSNALLRCCLRSMSVLHSSVVPTNQSVEVDHHCLRSMSVLHSSVVPTNQSVEVDSVEVDHHLLDAIFHTALALGDFPVLAGRRY